MKRIGGPWVSPDKRVALTAWRFAERFHIAESGCLLWTGSTLQSSSGIRYGKLWDSRQNRLGLAHRVVYEAIHGEIPLGMVLDHTCSQPLCVNPMHLEPVTQAENVARSQSRTGVAMHCVHGHPATEENCYRYRGNDGFMHRNCRVCGRIKATKRRAVQRALERLGR